MIRDEIYRILQEGKISLQIGIQSFLGRFARSAPCRDFTISLGSDAEDCA